MLLSMQLCLASLWHLMLKIQTIACGDLAVIQVLFAVMHNNSSYMIHDLYKEKDLNVMNCSFSLMLRYVWKLNNSLYIPYHEIQEVLCNKTSTCLIEGGAVSHLCFSFLYPFHITISFHPFSYIAFPFLLYVSAIIISLPFLGITEVFSTFPSSGVWGYPQPCCELVVVYTRWLFPLVLNDNGNMAVVLRTVVLLSSKLPVYHDTVCKVIV